MIDKLIFQDPQMSKYGPEKLRGKLSIADQKQEKCRRELERVKAEHHIAYAAVWYVLDRLWKKSKNICSTCLDKRFHAEPLVGSPTSKDGICDVCGERKEVFGKNDYRLPSWWGK